MVLLFPNNVTSFIILVLFGWIATWVVSPRPDLTVWNMNHDWGLCAPHAAGVVARVALRGEGDVQATDGAVLQEVRFDADEKK